MKKLLLLVVLAISFSNADAQITKDSLNKKIAVELCNVLQTKDFKGKTKDEISVEMGMEMLPLFTKYEEEIKSAYGLTDIMSESALYNIGKDIGMKLAMNCPSFLKMMADNKEMRGSILKTDKGSKDEEVVEITGKFTALNTGEFSTFTITNENGKSEKIYWLEYFEGEELLKSPATLKGKKVSVEYTTKEFYNAVLKDYVAVKIAKSLFVK